MNKVVRRRVPGLYEEFLSRIRNSGSKSGVRNIIRQAVSAGSEGALNEAEVNSLVRIGNRKIDNIYEARGGVNTYKPQATFGSREIGI